MEAPFGEKVPEQHISVGGALAVVIVAFIIVIGLFVLVGGFFSANSSMMMGGIVMIFFGLIVAGVNKFVFRVRTAQLSIDTKEAIRDKVRNACPNCGTINPTGSQFCNTCGRRLESR